MFVLLVAPTFKMTPELEAVVRDGFHINAGGTIRIHVPYHVRSQPIAQTVDTSKKFEYNVNYISLACKQTNEKLAF